ncbi:MAG TPA: hypothetical protein PKO15_02135 [Fibrobacteria bacterium]|nr:hypothetical protein [Fibrobacteria bacterium]
MQDDLFRYRQIDDIHPETQVFAAGLGPDDFHAMPSDHQDIQKLSLKDAQILEERVHIEGWRFDSDYKISLSSNGAYLFELMGLALIDMDKSSVVHEQILAEERGTLATTGVLASEPGTGNLVVAVRLAPSVDPSLNSVEIRRYTPSLSHSTLLKLPVDVEMIPFPDGFAILPSEQSSSDSVEAGYRVFDLHAQPAGGALGECLNAMLANGARIVAPSRSKWLENTLWCQGVARPWALFSHPAYPGGPSSLTSVLTIGSPPKAKGVAFETKRPVAERIDELVVPPKHDFFFASVQEGEDSTLLWLGVVRRIEGQFVAQTYRVRPFEKIHNLTISRDGSTILFATIHEDQWAITAAKVEDILTDINRRYPEAKLSLAALASEVK